MIQRKRAWDVMREDYTSVQEGTNISEVMKILRDKLKEHPESHMVLVLSETGQVKGAVTAWDVLSALEGCLFRTDKLKSLDETDWDAAFTKACTLCCSIEVEKVMHRNIPVVPPNHPLLLVLNEMVERKRNWSVVGEGGKPLGVILIGDLFREITRDMMLD